MDRSKAARLLPAGGYGALNLDRDLGTYRADTDVKRRNTVGLQGGQLRFLEVQDVPWLHRLNGPKGGVNLTQHNPGVE
jgi:hypothetical protein